MTEDEEFAASLRPESSLGALGAADEFEEEDYPEYDDGDAFYDTAPNYPQAQPAPYAQPQTNGLGSAPVAVSGAPTGQVNSGGALGAAITLFFLLAGGVAGWKYGRVPGAIGGALVAGGARNLYRAQKNMSTNTAVAVRNGIIGTVAVAGGGYALWTVNRK